MARFSSTALSFTFLWLKVWCQSETSNWIAPPLPDHSTSLEGGDQYTITWTSELADDIRGNCTSCDVEQVDLWVSGWVTGKDVYKIGSGVDVTRSLSYDWNVDIPSRVLEETLSWEFVFVALGENPQFVNEKVVSPAMWISDPESASTSSSIFSATSSAISSPTGSSITASTTPTVTQSTTPPPTVNNNQPKKNSQSKLWIAGVVVGPLIGIALGAAMIWLLLGRRRKNEQWKQDHPSVQYTPAQQNSPSIGYVQPTDVPELMSSQVEKKHQPGGTQPMAYHDTAPVAAPGRGPAELYGS